MPRSHLLAMLWTLGALGGAIAGCGPREATRGAGPEPDLLVTVSDGTVVAPDSVAAGWARIRVEERGGSHILVVFRLVGSATDADVAGFLTELDTAPATPASAVALGGPEIGDTGEIVIELTPGRYILGCVVRGSDGHRHAAVGEAKTILVTGAASGPPSASPTATQNVGMVDFAYVGPEKWPAGSHVLRVENQGRQDHQLRLERLRTGSTVQDWMTAENPGKHATPVAGVARLGPGRVAYLPVETPPGTYVMYCLVADPASGRPHVELGMLRVIQIE